MDPTASPAPPAAAPTAGLVLTGERTLPGIPDENYWFQRHVITYEHVAGRSPEQRPGDQHLTGMSVLDAGCGEGYGLAMLRDAGAARVAGVDLDESAVEHADRAYADEVVEVHRAELMDLPFDDDTFDLTVSFQVIEHLYDIPGYLASLRRVTRPTGTVVIATPNRLTFTPGSDVPVNPFHTREFTADELHDELTRAGLEVERIEGVHHGTLLRAAEHQLHHQPDGPQTFVDALTASEPDGWAPWIRDLVHRCKPGWFAIREDDLDASLDLIATCRVPA